MALSDDGESLYVVNHQDGTVSKVRTSDREILQTVHPAGWVAKYAGSLRVFADE